MKTTENNKIIAEFMGLNKKIVHFEKFYSWSDAPLFYTTEDSKEKVMENIAKYSKYHSDWNWLMEVVGNIDYLERNTDNEVFIQKVSTVTSLPLFTPKHTLYNACVEFIKWYNEQKN